MRLITLLPLVLAYVHFGLNATPCIPRRPYMQLSHSHPLLWLHLLSLLSIHHQVEDMEAMKSQFAKNYPGEILDAHSTPSVRLWSLIHQQKVNKHIKHVPIQLRLSEHQYCAMIETRSSKPLRSEIQLLSQLCWDDTPEMDINSVGFSRDRLDRIPTLLRNAYALCNMCHLQVIKTCDSKIAEYTSLHLDSALGLRHVVASEFIVADKKIGKGCLPAPRKRMDT